MATASVEIDNCRYEIQPEESGLTAYAAHDCDFLQWKIEFAAEAPRLCPSDHEGGDNVSAYLFFNAGETKGWLDLVGKAVAPPSTVGNMLPDDPAGFYCGYHLNTDEHRIAFSDCDQLAIHVDWRFVAFDTARGDEDTIVHLAGYLPLRGAVIAIGDEFSRLMRSAGAIKPVETVFHDWTPNWPLAESCLSRFFSLDDFGPPQKWRGPVYYPIREQPTERRGTRRST